MSNYNTSAADYKLMNYHNNNNNSVKRKESIHSGHFMISQFEVDEEEDEIMPQVPQDDIKMVIEPAATLGIEPAATLYNHQWRPTAIMSRRGRVKSSVIETSLTKLFECMSLAYRQKLTSPKWNRFKGIRLRWKDKIRLNNVIWRCWHMQFIIKKNALVCQFASPLDADTHNKPEAVVLEGKYWKRKLHAVTAEYKKWRQFFHLQRHEDADELADMLEWQPSSNESNSNASMLLDEDYMEFMSDTLFSTLSSQPFFFPDSKELTRVASIADFIQPSLVQLQPNLDDLMEVFEPFHDMICPKLPTVPEEQFPSPSSSLPSSLPTHLSHPAPKHRPNPNTITIIAAQSGSTQNLPKSDYLSSSSANLAVNNLTNALAGNNISLSTGNVLKSDYRSQMSHQNVVKSVDYVDKRSESLGAGQLLHHHPNIIYSSGGGAQTSGGSTLMSLTNTGAKSGAAGGRGKGGEGGYNFAMPGGEKPSVFSYAPAASASKPAPPPSYPYAGAHPNPLKARDEYPNTAGGGYAEKPSGASGQQMYNNFDKLNIVQYNYGGKSVQYASYEKDPYKQESYQKPQESYQKPEESYQKPHESYHKTQESYQKSSVASLNQGYDKSGNLNLNQGGYDKTGSSSLNQGYDKVGALHQGYGKAGLNQGYDKVESASLNQVNQISGDQYGSYGAQYMQDSREEYSTSSAGGYSYHPSQQLSYAPDSSYAHNSMGSGAQYAHHLGRAQHTPPTSTGAYGYYREPSPYQQALDFKLPPPAAAPTPSPASSLSSPYPSPSRRPSLGQGPPQSPEGGPCPHSPGNLRHRPPGQGGPEDYALPPKPQVMKTRHRTRSSCNLVKPRYFLNTATDPNLVHHNSALLAQLLTSNSHTSYGGLPKASAVCTGETISCPGYTGRSRTPDSVYVPPPQEQVIPPAPPSYPPYPPKSAFLVSSQSEGSLFNLINSRAANFSQQNSVLQRQTRIIQEKNQQAQQRNNASASSQQQSQFNMSGASSSSSLAATSPSPSSRHPDSPPLPPTTQEPSSLSPPAPGSSPPQSHPHPHQLLARPAAPPYKEHRRVCHINAEQKRRCNIKNGFDTLHLLIPHLSHNPNTKMSKAAMLQKGAEYIKQLRGERAQLKEEMEALRLEVETLNAQISNSQSLLPATGAPVSRHRATRMRNMFHAHVALRSRTNWKFWLLSLICAPLLESYAGAVSGESMEELYRTTLAWSEQHCSLGNLRPIVLSALRYLSTETEILSDPSLLSEEALRAVNRPNS